MLAAVPIFLPADGPLDAEEVPADASFTRPFVPEIDILQRERTDEHPAWIWTVANMVVLLCSLAIILGITMWIQQKLNPMPVDPAQAQVMAIMPWVFMFVMASFAAGLQLYWITNNLISIGQQKLFMRRYPVPAA